MPERGDRCPGRDTLAATVAHRVAGVARFGAGRRRCVHGMRTVVCVVRQIFFSRFRFCSATNRAGDLRRSRRRAGRRRQRLFQIPVVRPCDPVRSVIHADARMVVFIDRSPLAVAVAVRGHKPGFGQRAVCTAQHRVSIRFAGRRAFLHDHTEIMRPPWDIMLCAERRFGGIRIGVERQARRQGVRLLIRRCGFIKQVIVQLVFVLTRDRG